MIPFASSSHHLVLPMSGLGLAIGMVDSSMMPELANIVDKRYHSAAYGSVYAIGDVAFCFGFAIGPTLSGSLVKTLGFPVIVSGLGLFCFAFSPFLSYLKDLPDRRKKESMELQDFLEGEQTNLPYQAFIEEKNV